MSTQTNTRTIEFVGIKPNETVFIKLQQTSVPTTILAYARSIIVEDTVLVSFDESIPSLLEALAVREYTDAVAMFEEEQNAYKELEATAREEGGNILRERQDKAKTGILTYLNSYILSKARPLHTISAKIRSGEKLTSNEVDDIASRVYTILRNVDKRVASAFKEELRKACQGQDVGNPELFYSVLAEHVNGDFRAMLSDEAEVELSEPRKPEIIDSLEQVVQTWYSREAVPETTEADDALVKTKHLVRRLEAAVERITDKYAFIKLGEVDYPQTLQPVKFDGDIPEKLQPHYRSLVQLARDVGGLAYAFTKVAPSYFKDNGLWEEETSKWEDPDDLYNLFLRAVCACVLPDLAGTHYVLLGNVRMKRNNLPYKRAEEAAITLREALTEGLLDAWVSEKYFGDSNGNVADTVRLQETLGYVVGILPNSVYIWLNDTNKLREENPRSKKIFQDTREHMPQATARLKGIENSLKTDFAINPEDMRNFELSFLTDTLDTYGLSRFEFTKDLLDSRT